jgi:hypothetical protein
MPPVSYFPKKSFAPKESKAGVGGGVAGACAVAVPSAKKSPRIKVQNSDFIKTMRFDDELCFGNYMKQSKVFCGSFQ